MTPVIVVVLILVIIVSIVVLSKKNNAITTDMPTSAWSKDLRKGIRKNPTTGTSTYDWKLKETWEDYPMPDYNAVHTYCQVAFDDSGKSFYYRTRNPELRVGDTVYVPVGYKYEKKVGRIISMKNYKGKNAPYPLERTKHIIGKVD